MDKPPLPKVHGREMQELEYHFTPSSSEASTPWESEVGSEVSERPEQGECHHTKQ